MLRDDHEAYYEAQLEFARVTGGTKEEIEAYWERTKGDTYAVRTRIVLLDGTVLGERSGGSEHLRRRVMKRLAGERKWDDEDAALIEEMAKLLGMEIEGT